MLPRFPAKHIPTQSDTQNIRAQELDLAFAHLGPFFFAHGDQPKLVQQDHVADADDAVETPEDNTRVDPVSEWRPVQPSGDQVPAGTCQRACLVDLTKGLRDHDQVPDQECLVANVTKPTERSDCQERVEDDSDHALDPVSPESSSVPDGTYPLHIGLINRVLARGHAMIIRFHVPTYFQDTHPFWIRPIVCTHEKIRHSRPEARCRTFSF